MEIEVVKPFRAIRGKVKDAVLHVHSSTAGFSSEITDVPEGITVNSRYTDDPDGYVWVIEVKPEALFELENVLNRIFELEEGLESEALRYRDVLFSIVEHWAKEMGVNVINGEV